MKDPNLKFETLQELVNFIYTDSFDETKISVSELVTSFYLYYNEQGVSSSEKLGAKVMI